MIHYFQYIPGVNLKAILGKKKENQGKNYWKWILRNNHLLMNLFNVKEKTSKDMTKNGIKC